jgi:hypothetical protein
MYSDQENLKQESKIWSFQLKDGCTRIAMNLSLEEAIFDNWGLEVTLLNLHLGGTQERGLQ